MHTIKWGLVLSLVAGMTSFCVVHGGLSNSQELKQAIAIKEKALEKLKAEAAMAMMYFDSPCGNSRVCGVEAHERRPQSPIAAGSSLNRSDSIGRFPSQR